MEVPEAILEYISLLVIVQLTYSTIELGIPTSQCPMFSYYHLHVVYQALHTGPKVP